MKKRRDQKMRMKNKKSNTLKNQKRLRIFQKDYEKKFEKNYYKPIKTKSTFNNNYIEYESRGDKSKNLSPEDYLDIKPFLRNR